jgi:homocysteine S-methyltransferase
MHRFAAALARDEALLLDGGLATELEAQGYDINSRLWSAALLHQRPEAIVSAHLAYLEAGAQCIISASYQASREGLMSLGINATEADALIVRSVHLAQQARESFLAAHADTSLTPLVAASVGPYGATLHDGSEYTGSYAISEPGLRAFHEQRLQILDQAGADVLACETIPAIAEARVLGELLREAETPAWISFSCRNGRDLSDGTPLRDAAALFRDHPRVLAIGVNCTAPQFISSLITEIRSVAPDKAIVVYPNSGERYEAIDNSWHGTAKPLECAAAAAAWREAGAHMIGGCCRMGPEHIAAMGRAVRGKPA